MIKTRGAPPVKGFNVPGAIGSQQTVVSTYNNLYQHGPYLSFKLRF